MEKVLLLGGNILRKIETELDAKSYSYVQEYCLPFPIIELLRAQHEALEQEYEETHETMPKELRRKNYLSKRIQKSYLDTCKFKTTSEDGANVYWLTQMTISKNELGVEHVSIYIRLTGFASEAQKNDVLPVVYRISILNSTGKHVHTKCSPLRQFSLEDTPCWGWQYYIPVNRLGRSGLQGRVTFKLQMRIFQNASTPAKVTTTLSVQPDSVAKTWRINDDWDLIIACPDMSFRAHRAILTAVAVSPSLANALRLENLQMIRYKDKDRFIFLAPDTESHLVEGILEFCYTRKTNLFDDVLQCARLCSLGRAWQIKDLSKQAFLHLSNPDILKLWNFTFVFKQAVCVLDQSEALINVEKFVVENRAELKNVIEFQKLLENQMYAMIYASLFF